MTEVAIRFPKKRLIEGLSALSFNDIKDIMDSLIHKKLFQPPTVNSIYKEASKAVIRQKLSKEVSIEAVKWSRKQK